MRAIESTECLVIGAGLIGLLCARELARAGRRVTVLERGEAGREASWAGGGILSPLYPWRAPAPVMRLARWGQVRYPELAAALLQETGVDVEWAETGLLVLEATEEAQARKWAHTYDSALEVLALDEACALAPELAETVVSFDRALWLAHVAQVRNPRLVRALRESLQGLGVVTREHTEAAELLVEDGRAAGVRTGAGIVEAGTVVVACGAWSAGLLERLGPAPPVEPVRGQMLLFRAAPGTLSRILLFEGHYVIPRRDGRVLAGSTLETVGFDKGTTEAAFQELHEAAVKLIPALETCPVEAHWAGLRPGSPDEIPYIGEHPHYQGLYVNTGHYRNGLVLAPASARLLTDLILGHPPILDPAPYALSGRLVSRSD